MSAPNKIFSVSLVTTTPISLERAKELWVSLEQSIGKIFAFQASTLSFEESYRKAYDLVIQKHGNVLYSGLTATLRAQCEAITEQLMRASDFSLISAVDVSWQDYKRGLNIVKDILMYMDRNYIKNHQLASSYELGVKVFRETVFYNEKLRGKIRGFLLENVRVEREGGLRDRGLMKRVLTMLLDSGLSSKQTYRDLFEDPLLTETTEYYQKEAQDLVTSAACPEFLRKAEERYREESARVLDYMDPSTEKPLMAILDKNFILDHCKALIYMENSGCLKLIQNSCFEDLNRMYNLFSLLPSCVRALSEFLASHIEQEGGKLVLDPGFKKDPHALVQVLLEFRAKYYSLVGAAFNRDPAIETMVQLSFENFINLNRVAVQSLNLYLDSFFKKDIKGASEDSLSNTLDQSIVLFRLLRDKDAFENLYRHYLAKRLLNDCTLSDDAEKTMITKLKTECGSHYTNKLEGMVKDMKLSQEFTQQLPRTGEPTINLRVLTAAFWPSEQAPAATIPEDLLQQVHQYTAVFLSKYTGRRLNWSASMGTCELRASLGTVRSKHELLVSTYQMSILLLFNEAEVLTLQEITETLKCMDEELTRHLLGIVKSGILHKSTKGKELLPSTELGLNMGFKSRLFRIKLPVVPAKKKEENLISEELPPTVEEDRKHLVDAYIVRVMKTRRHALHYSLIEEVTRLISDRFIPDTKLIKLRIDGLIEREYIERDSNNPILYKYIA